MTTSLYPTANSVSGSGTYFGGSSNYANLSDSSDSSWVLINNANGSQSWPLTDMPGDFDYVLTASIVIRAAKAAKGDIATLDYVQLMLADDVTPLTSTGTATLTSSIANYTITPSTLHYLDITSWAGALLRIKQSNNTSGISVYEARVDITYSVVVSNYIKQSIIHSFAIPRATRY